jgi:hypothetical protein
MSSELVILYKKIDTNMSNPIHKKRLLDLCKGWFDSNTSIITANTLEERPYFPVSLEDEMMESIGVTRDDIKNTMKRIPSVNSAWKVLNSEYILAMSLVVRFFLKEKNELATRIVYMVIVYRHYSMLHKRQFPHGTKKEVMDYMVNQLSLKNDLKRLGSLNSALEKMAENCHAGYIKDLTSNDDEQILKYSVNMWSRTNSFVVNYARQYYDINDKKLYMNVDDTSNEGEEDNYRPERGSDSGAVYNVARGAFMHFLSTAPDERLINIAARGNEISTGMLRSALEILRKKGDEGVEHIMVSILELLISEKHDPEFKIVCTQMYLPFVLSIYARSNITDKNIILIKNNLSRMLADNCPRFQETQREATKISYRRALFTYIALIIQIGRCGS